jgi:plastocyanin
MSALDSRSLTYLDCFGQRFSAPGSVRYAITSPTAAYLEVDDKPFIVDVGAQESAEPQQHDVAVDFRGGEFTATPSELKISAGDVIVWHSPGATPPYSVWGQSEDGPFSSMSLSNAAFYSHAFGAPGDIRWMDVHGSGLRGTIRVSNVETENRDSRGMWARQLNEGTVVAIEGNTAKQEELEIVVGQTVFFAVGDSQGVTITDETLIPSRNDS